MTLNWHNHALGLGNDWQEAEAECLVGKCRVWHVTSGKYVWMFSSAFRFTMELRGTSAICNTDADILSEKLENCLQKNISKSAQQQQRYFTDVMNCYLAKALLFHGI